MLISRMARCRFAAGLVFAALVPLAIAGASAAGRQVTFTSPKEAYEQGMSSYRSGYIELAIPALEFAAGKGNFLAQFYLARIYADNTTPHTDHAKAYVLYQRLADEHADVDPDYDQRAPFVAKALTALAGYVRLGVAEIGLKPDVERAAEYLRYAATFFNDEEAQFQLAKLYLKGEGVPENTRRAMHWLSVLTQQGHAGAQAFLADILWRGKLIKPDPLKAFALISVAVENAPPSERVWIEDIYQTIFCGASEGTRRQAAGMVADWRQRYGRTVDKTDQSGVDRSQPRNVRKCSNGERIPSLAEPQPAAPERPAERLATPQGPDNPATLQPGMLGFQLKDAGAALAPSSGR